MKISFDFDKTLQREDIQQLAKKKLAEGNDVYIITRRFKQFDSKEVYDMASKLGIKKENVYFTNGKWKYKTIKQLGINQHYDDKPEELVLIRIATKAKGIQV